MDFTTLDSRIDATYQRGPYLIYDCVEMRWICTGRPEFDVCAERRDTSLAMKDNELGCAPFTNFRSRKKCHKKQLEMINRASFPRFCFHPEYKERNKDFWQSK